MQDLNTITIIGRLTKDAKVEYTQGGTALCNISIASNESQKDGDNWKDYANFFDVTVWGKQAEGLAQYLTKGKQIAVEGKLHQDRWESDGQKHSRVKITAQSIQLLGGGKKEDAPAAAQQSAPAQQSTPAASDDTFPDDTIPF
jgi:single-strand DNA-binding protein